MDYIVPKIRTGVTMHSTEGAKIRLHGQVDAEVSTEQAAFVMLMDGQTSMAVIRGRAARLGIDLPEPTLKGLLERLEGSGIVERADISDAPHEVLDGTTHHCVGCGQSCYGHLIGPLPRSEVQRIEKAWPTLVEAAPRLEGRKPFLTSEGLEGIYLNMEDGKCVFLDSDNLCAIHKHVGMDAKPAACQTFPFSRVLTEEGLRFGLNVACLKNRFADNPSHAAPRVVDLDEDLRAVPPSRMDRSFFPRFPLSTSPSDASERRAFRANEREMIDYLGRREATVEGLLKVLADEPPTSRVADARAIPVETLKTAAALLGDFHRRLDLEASAAKVILDQGEGLGRYFRVLLDGLELLEEGGGLDIEVGYVRREEQHFLTMLRHVTFTRVPLFFEDILVGFSTFILGWIFSLWAARHHGDRWPTPSLPIDEITAEHMAVWFRFLNLYKEDPRVFEPRKNAIAWLNIARRTLREEGG